MKNLNQVDCIELTYSESQKIEGGAPSNSGLWNDLAYFGGVIVQGLISVSTQSGKNAGIFAK